MAKKVRIKSLRRLFHYKNRKYFGGRLPVPKRFSIRKIRHLGETTFVVKRKGKKLVEVSELVISPKIKDMGTVAEMVLLHEMIHIKLRQRRKSSRCDQNPLFDREIRRLARLGAYDKIL